MKRIISGLFTLGLNGAIFNATSTSDGLVLTEQSGGGWSMAVHEP